MIKAVLGFLFKGSKSKNELQTNGSENISIEGHEKYIPKSIPISISEHQIHIFTEAEINRRLSGQDTVDIDHADKLLKECATLIIQHQQSSTSLIQRKLKLGYNRASKIIDQLETLDIIGQFDGSHARTVNVKSVDELEPIFAQLTPFVSKERAFFEREILPLKLSYVEQCVVERKFYAEQRRVEEIRLEIRQDILVKEANKKKEQHLRELKQRVIKEMIDNGEIEGYLDERTREPIQQSVKDLVWNRDGGRCVYCGGNEMLEFDHIIPFVKGGSNTYRNIQLLCESCNRVKSAKLGD